jgi:hypothetical protein
MTEMPLQGIRDRRQMIRFFDGYAAERMDELEERRLRRPVVKTHLLELMDGGCHPTSEGLVAILARRQFRLEPLEDDLFLVYESGLELGFLERLQPRVVALYSTLRAEDIGARIRHLVLRTPEIDHVWLSGLTFGVLWQFVVQLSRPHRFTRLVFTHDSVFDVDAEGPELDEDEEGRPNEPLDEDLEPVIERRATTFRLVDRVGEIDRKLKALQNLYYPFYAISQLRFPSPVGRGGHDFFDHGRVTNKSPSFRDHRSHLMFVVRIYQNLLRSTEEQAWYSIRESAGVPGEFRKIVGAPVVIRFREALSAPVFEQWIGSTFGRKRNRFRLWGHPIRLGPTTVQVYGVDRHLWQPLFLELTARGCVAVIPNGTCGNTLHRLVTNIQRYLDPGAEVFIGDKPYTQMVEESAQGVRYGDDNE